MNEISFMDLLHKIHRNENILHYKLDYLQILNVHLYSIMTVVIWYLHHQEYKTEDI